MKLGVCYMVFDGFELLEYAARSVRTQADFVAATYQSTSYFGNPAEPGLEATMKKLLRDGLLDEIRHFEPNLKIHHKQNELALRNLGLAMSRKAGCTHHVSADVDEIYKPDELAYAKNNLGDADHSLATYAMYYRRPTYLIQPSQKLQTTFIHPVNNPYEMNDTLRYIEPTRRPKYRDKVRIFTENEITIHHMSYVRRDIRWKLANSDNGRCYRKLDKFVEDFNNYKLGGRVCIAPDFMNRKTVEVDNIFGIKI